MTLKELLDSEYRDIFKIDMDDPNRPNVLRIFQPDFISFNAKTCKIVDFGSGVTISTDTLSLSLMKSGSTHIVIF